MTIRPLCTFPSGPKSSSQVAKAKALLRQSVLGGCEVRLLSVTDLHEQTHSLTAFYDARDPLAAAWVCEAEKAAPHVTELVIRMGQRELLR